MIPNGIVFVEPGIPIIVPLYKFKEGIDLVLPYKCLHLIPQSYNSFIFKQQKTTNNNNNNNSNSVYGGESEMISNSTLYPQQRPTQNMLT